MQKEALRPRAWHFEERAGRQAKHWGYLIEGTPPEEEKGLP